MAEASPAVAAATPAPSDYSYPQRLGSDRPEEGLDRSRPGGTATPAATPRPGAAPVRPAATDSGSRLRRRQTHSDSGRCQTHSDSGRRPDAPAADASPARGHAAGRPGHRPPAQGPRLLREGLRDPGGGLQGPGERRQHRAGPEGPRVARVRDGPDAAAASSPCASGCTATGPTPRPCRSACATTSSSPTSSSSSVTAPLRRDRDARAPARVGPQGEPARSRCARGARAPAGGVAPHGVRGGALPQPRGVLHARHRHLHAPRRPLHPPVRLLRGLDRAAGSRPTPPSPGAWRRRRPCAWACATSC